MKIAWGLVAAAVLTACGGVSPPSLPSAPAQSAKGWLAPDIASASQLLFVVDSAYAAVEIFTLPDLKKKGSLTGFKFPTGACSDKSGNVWIADYQTNALTGYSHSGKPIGKIANAGTEPYGCAVNPASGAIAVMDYLGSKGGPGQILVYSKPAAKPVVLTNPDVNNYFNGVYDPSGNLWVTGFGTEFPVLSKCGASSCKTVVLHGGSIFTPGPIAWDNARHGPIVFDQYCHETTAMCSYPVSTSGEIGTPTTYLNPSANPLCLVNGAIVAGSGARTIVVGADNEYNCAGYNASSVDTWSYPAGGNPTRTATSGVVYPWGAAISSK